MSHKTSVVILAAGKGTRMKSDVPKVLHPVAGEPMLSHAVKAAQGVGAAQILVVVGYGAEQVKAQMGSELDYVLQDPQLGTGHAMQLALPALSADDGELIVTYGDMPLLSAKILADLRSYRQQKNAAAVVLTTRMDPPGSFGRILRNKAGDLLAIVENKDCSPEQKEINEVNVAVYCFSLPPLKKALTRLSNNNAQGEYYLTDVIALLREDQQEVAAMLSDDAEACLGVNDLLDLQRADQIMRRRVEQHA